MRGNWVSYLEKIVFPVLDAAAEDRLKETMPIFKDRSEFQYLEAIGRIVCGIAPWLNLPDDTSDEGELRANYLDLTLKAITNLVNPNSRDYIDFGLGGQALVDAAYLSQGLLRAPNLWNALGTEVQDKLLHEIKKTRNIKPPKSNWLLFASMVEAFLLKYGDDFNRKRLNYGVRKFIKNYYKGDGLYGDGTNLSIDYYNSYVIHPMLMDILEIMITHKFKESNRYLIKQKPRYQRYVEIQERMISPEGAYPLFGRTLICRFGAFHALAQAAFLELLPKNINFSQVRCALNAVLKRQIEMSKNFDSDGFMTIGFNGMQERMAESYVSSGSPYHCCSVFLPLGLSCDHPFWKDEDSEWTSLKAFNGQEFEQDKSFHEKSVKQEFFMPLVYKCQSGLRKLKNLFKS
ncbi:DUF2264 domain-containing protein [Algibacter aquimarinus]|uniref:DUF2264 domain-containing protein n=1 Tax=Algibacter aquimarinus TaxID=1136748 RepID=A0ABP9HKU9_9FLAO